MAPEQIYQLPPDPRIDIYAMGILLYEMIIGRRPFSGADMAATIKMQLSESPKRPSELLGEGVISPELEQVIMRALEKDRIDRHGTASEMRSALRRTPEARAAAAAASRSSITPGAMEVPQRAVPAWRSRKLVLAGVSAALLLGAVAAAALRDPSPPPAPPPPPLTVKAAATEPEAVPPPAPVVHTWLIHRDLAVTYSARGQHDDAFREVTAALADNPAAAGADPALVQAAVSALTPKRVTFMLDAFKPNPKLIETLAQATAAGATSELRHAAHEGLRALDQESQADLVAMWILDVRQATSCSSIRAAYKKVRSSNDPRLYALNAELRKRDRKDAHVRCLRRYLRR
jgi:hypothetical protein